MPHFPHAPEALLGRNDSKNPATTCRGITSSGRPCRRALASPKSSPITPRKNNSGVGGVVAIVQENGQIEEANFYCWQHKNQAEQKVREEDSKQEKGGKVKRRSTELFVLKERSSIDTLVQKLGISDTSEEKNTHPGEWTSNPKPPCKTATTDFATLQRTSGAPYTAKYNIGDVPRPPKKKHGFWASLCCLANDDDDNYVEIVRHKKRIDQTRPLETVQTRHATAAAPPTIQNNPSRKQTRPKSSHKPSLQSRLSPGSQTSDLLSLVPKNLSPQTTSALFAELTKPISPHDEEGYIYIFWLTPQAKSTPPESTTRSLLAPSTTRPDHHRRISEVMTDYSYDGEDDSNASKTGSRDRQKTIMLKIGRANNVTRRMNEWQRQCGYALNLVRWYPYVPSSGTPSPQASPNREIPLYPDLSRPPPVKRESSGVHKVPCVKRVERLIHLELSGKQIRRQCTACSKEHREWFEVEASQAGVKAVDETVRRWVGWGERQNQG